MKLLHVVGARPNFVKLAAVQAELKGGTGVESITVHTGQHYDRRLSELFFDELGLPAPEVHLGIRARTSLEQLGRTIRDLEPILKDRKPDRVVVYGDVNSTLAAALAASRLGLPLAHVEAGLRSFDPTMPEEINRRLTDSLSDHLFATESSAVTNLEREGIPSDRVHLVGNVMIDTLLRFRERALSMEIPERHGLRPGAYGVLTLHRPATVDHRSRLEPLLRALVRVSRELPLVFPVHPRTRARMPPWIEDSRIRLREPAGYLEFLGLLGGARLVLTDSGGVQEECTVLGVPCLTVRDRTERPVTVSHGTNRVVGTDPERVLGEVGRCLAAPPAPGRVPPLWDGKAARRLLSILTG